jgi:hypothetical protein
MLVVVPSSGLKTFWVDAQNGCHVETRVAATKKGARIEADNIGPNAIGQCGVVLRGRAARRRISCLRTLFTQFLPGLRKVGFSDADIRQMLVANASLAFVTRVRSMRSAA